ncbi:hypothetical protein AGMMS49938_07780 [Fibrobacterales bacterium]|nr:hypothetical protein AGMMS49938_07780 [Fibrobacterales bacterium]
MIESDKNFTILIVGDDLVSCDILSSILSPYYSIKTAENVDSARWCLKNETINLVLLYTSIENDSGFKILSGIKTSDDTKFIPVILVSDSSSEAEEDEERGFTFGAADFLTKPFRSSIVKVRVNNQRLIVKQMKAIEELGLLDSLTGISNRRGFNSKMNAEWLRAIRDQKPLSMAIADIDFFKRYNDTYGHQQGDVLLRELAKRIKSLMKRPADFVARWGGEEFVIMLPNTEIDGAYFFSNEIRQSIQKMHIKDLPSATISIGVSCIVPQIKDSMEEFFERADKALYKAKESGRNRVCRG